MLKPESNIWNQIGCMSADGTGLARSNHKLVSKSAAKNYDINDKIVILIVNKTLKGTNKIVLYHQ